MKIRLKFSIKIMDLNFKIFKCGVAPKITPHDHKRKFGANNQTLDIAVLMRLYTTFEV